MNLKKIFAGFSKINTVLFCTTLGFAFLAVLFFARAFRSTEYLVLVDDEVYDAYEETIKNTACDFFNKNVSFEKNSLSTYESKSFFGKSKKIAAVIHAESETSIAPKTYQKNQVFYEVFNNAMLASIPTDFNSAPSVANSLSAPELSISLTTIEDLPQNNRALLVNDVYAGSDDYLLNIRSGVLCTLYEESLKNQMDDFCKKVFAVKKQKPRLVTIASVGDIMVARGIQEILINNEDGLKKVFSDTLPLLQGADFTLGNLEGVVTESWKNAIKTYTFKFKKEVLPKLLDAGFDYLMQTNNHCYDYGESGFKDTLSAFEEYKIPSSGIGHNIEEAKKFYHTEINGLKISVISCGAFPVERSGFNGEKTASATETRAGILWKSDELLSLVKKEKESGYFVIVNVHGGEEYRFTPTKSQREFYEALCTNGADVVFGSHPHVLQPTQWFNSSLIVYSMGNFLFNGMEGMRGGTDSEIVKLGILDGKISYVEQYPVAIKNNGVVLKK